MNCNIHHNSVNMARSNQKKTKALGITAFVHKPLSDEKKATKKAAEAAFPKRSRADSNRCSRFCRPEPSHSATGPCMLKITRVDLERAANIECFI